MVSEGDKRVIIVGGGASGVLLASHLLRDAARQIRVTIIERTSAAGFGLAYSTVNPHHLLNVRAANMSAFPDQPDHFWNWMVANGLCHTPDCNDAFCFVPRMIYGRYLADLLAAPPPRGEAGPKLQVIRGECVLLRRFGRGVEVQLADGTRHSGDYAVLATGNEAPAVSYGICDADPWREPAQAGLAPSDPVLVLGSGLTMVDYVLTLLRAGHTGSVLVISRRGLLPQPHRRAKPWPIEESEIPMGAEVSAVMHWLRGEIEAASSQGRDWRDVIDGLRPFIQRIWQNWPLPAKHRFIRHARVWWDVHRHRTAPEADRRLRAAITSGQLRVVAAKIESVETGNAGVAVRYRRRGASHVETAHVAKIAQCIGVAIDPRRSSNPVLKNLFERGLARADPTQLGIDVTPDCAVIDGRGGSTPRLLAIGPLTRGRFWEITAIPDIRVQCAKVAELIADHCLAAFQQTNPPDGGTSVPQPITRMLQPGFHH